MTKILLSFREEGDQDTNVTNCIHNTTSDSDISTSNTVETDERNTEVTTQIEELRNYDTEQSATVELVNFESLELQIHELITTELDTQIKLDELISIQKQNFIVNYSLMFVFIFLSVMIVIYKFIAGALFFD